MGLADYEALSSGVAFWLSLHLGILALVLDWGFDIFLLEGLEIINDILIIFFQFKILELRLSEILLLPKIRKFGWTVILFEVQAAVELGQLLKEDNLAVGKSLFLGRLSLMEPQQSLPDIGLLFETLSSLLGLYYLF